MLPPGMRLYLSETTLLQEQMMMSPAPVASTACTEDTSLRWGREEKAKKAFLLQDCGQHKAPLSNLPLPGSHGVAMPQVGAAGGEKHTPFPTRPAPHRGALPVAPFPPYAGPERRTAPRQSG